MGRRQSTLRDVVGGALVLGALALPVVHTLSDGAARMEVRFRTNDMDNAKGFSAQTSQSACEVLAAALSYENRATGEYTHIACD